MAELILLENPARQHQILEQMRAISSRRSELACADCLRYGSAAHTDSLYVWTKISIRPLE